VFEIEPPDFLIPEFGVTVPQTVCKQVSPELCQFKSFAQALVRRHAAKDLNIKLMMRARFRIHTPEYTSKGCKNQDSRTPRAGDAGNPELHLGRTKTAGCVSTSGSVALVNQIRQNTASSGRRDLLQSTFYNLPSAMFSRNGPTSPNNGFVGQAVPPALRYGGMSAFKDSALSGILRSGTQNADLPLPIFHLQSTIFNVWSERPRHKTSR